MSLHYYSSNKQNELMFSGDFMKKILIGLIAVASLINTIAGAHEYNGPFNVQLSNAQVEKDNTYFETLGDLYSEGVRAEISMLINKAWIGRCFMKNHPNEPKASGYVFRIKKVPDVGPLGAGKLSYEAAAFISNKAPDFYDQDSLNDILESLSASQIQFEKAKVFNDEITMRTSISSEVSIKRSGKYLVTEGFTINKVRPFSNNDVFARCYYFIPESRNN